MKSHRNNLLGYREDSLVEEINGITGEKRLNYNFMPRDVYRDNKQVYNVSNKGRGGDKPNPIRVPSLKRSNATWKKFYSLFPFLKGKKTYGSIKLKQI